MDPRPSVLIIGGGVAGLSSALAHLEAGFRVKLAEKRSILGGRAWSDSQGIDNGPHVILGCYEHFRKLLRSLGTEDFFERGDTLQLTWLFKGGRVLRLRPPKLPAPLHLLQGLLRLDLPLKNRLGLIRGSLALRLPLPPKGTTLQQWFTQRKIKGDTQSLLFLPLCRAVMNVEPKRADARLFLKTLRVAFRGSREDGAIWCPNAPWSEIIHQAAVTFFKEKKMEILWEGVRKIDLSPEREVHSVVLTSGKKVDGLDRVVLAVPWNEAARMAPFGSFAKKVQEIESSPIVSVSFPAAGAAGKAFPFKERLLSLVGGEPFHFLCKNPSPKGWWTLLAGSAEYPGLYSKEDWLRAASNCLLTFLNDEELTPNGMIQGAEVRREANATIAATPCAERFRPPPGPTEIRGLWIAGDWTKTGFPSTLEGAAKSGFLDPHSPNKRLQARTPW